MKILILVVLITLICFNRCDENSFVQVLTSENFEEFIQTNEYVLVEFYAPWCGHCKLLAPEYESAAQQLSVEGSKIKLAKVDATAEQSLADQFSIEGYPTLYFFQLGKQIEYSGGRTSQLIVQWLKQKTGPVSQLIISIDDLKQIQSNNEFTVAFFGQQEESEQFKSFLNVAKLFAGLKNFIHCFDHQVALSEELAQLPALVVYERDDNQQHQRHQFQGKWDGEEIESFIKLNTIPSLMTFDENVAEIIFGQNNPVLFLLYGEGGLNQQALDSLVAVQKDFKGKLLLVKLDLANEYGERLAEFVGITASDSPQFFIMEFDEQGVQKYLLKSSEYNVDILNQFYQDFKDKKLQPTFRSQEIPETNDEFPRVVVGKNYEELVIKNEKDVVVEFYASWCQHCLELAPIYKEIAQEFSESQPNILVYKIDGVENEIPQIQLESFPTIFLYKAGEKEHPVQFEGQNTKEEILQFIQNNSKQLNSNQHVVIDDL